MFCDGSTPLARHPIRGPHCCACCRARGVLSHLCLTLTRSLRPPCPPVPLPPCPPAPLPPCPPAPLPPCPPAPLPPCPPAPLPPCPPALLPTCPPALTRTPTHTNTRCRAPVLPGMATSLLSPSHSVGSAGSSPKRTSSKPHGVGVRPGLGNWTESLTFSVTDPREVQDRFADSATRRRWGPPVVHAPDVDFAPPRGCHGNVCAVRRGC
jgi:hypothetical protein